MAEVSTAVKTSDSHSRSRDRPIARAATTPVEPGSSGSNSNSNSTDGGKPALVRSSHSTPIGATNVAPVYGDAKDARKSLAGLVTAQASSSPDELSQSPIDPLSQHILKRTQTDKSLSSKLRLQSTHGPEAGGTDGASKLSPTDQGVLRGDISGALKNTKDKKKGVSFLSRFIGSKRKDQLSESNDNASDLQDDGTNGMDEIFAHPVGFIPRFPPPPKYIKAKAYYKKQRTFDRVFLAQELRGTDDAAAGGEDSWSTNQKAIWALEFSKDGKYLAAAGQDKTVRVWAVITNAEDREAHEQEEDEAKGEDEGLRLTAPVFKSKPIREYTGHMGSVLDLSWSKNNFLLSSSMDRTVRLWHVSRLECLCCFKHSDFVTSIQFHPRDDRFFLAGSLDSKLRLWSIPDKSVAFWATVPDMITAVAFTPDGKHSIAGCLNGLCVLYETDGLKATAQVHVRSARGRNAKGSKITGIDTIMQPPNDPKGEVKLLITSNDSRIRLYNFRDRSLEAKYRGNENTTSQIRASFSDDGKHIICGSEDRRTYIWPTGSGEKEPDKRAVEVLETRTAIVTCAVMAPTATKQLLGFSGDPVYDLCNPPPVTLVSQTESSKPNGQNSTEDPLAARANDALKAQASPAYLARSTHPGGNIIIVADYLGKIKVFRQDCAYQKRPNDWDASSTFSRKLLGRSNSARHSIASSIGRESKTPSERILAWRNSVIGTELASVSSRDIRPGSSSPRKSLSRRSRYSSPVRSAVTKSESGYETPRSRSSIGSRGSDRDESKPSVLVGEPESPSSPEIPPDGNEGLAASFTETGQSNAFWAKAAQTIQSANSQRFLNPNDVQGERRRSSVPSALSSDLSSLSGDPDEGEVLRCARCRGTNFRATKTRGRQRLVCVKCNTPQTM